MPAPSAQIRTRAPRWPRWLRALGAPVPLAVLVALVLHTAWSLGLASGGGDLAAQDAWAQFARLHPSSAYDLAWYGGLSPVSYSVVSPYVMALLGVRATMVVAGTVSAGLLALLLVRLPGVARPRWPAVYGAVALSLNAVSGRVTFGLGGMVALAALLLALDPATMDPALDRSVSTLRRRLRLSGVAALAGLATACSPVAGLFLGVLAVSLWWQRRRAVALALALPPIVVVGVCAWLFPFSGEQPMGWTSVLLPLAVTLAVVVLTPPAWRTVRIAGVLYAAGIVAAWLVPSEIGTNVSRLGLIYGGVVLVAVLVGQDRGRAHLPDLLVDRVARVLPRPGRMTVATTALVGAVAVSSVWQVGVAAGDVSHTRTSADLVADVPPLVAQLDARGADLGRVEVVPMRSHLEASVLPAYVNLARGWNRQADAGRNPIFYDSGLLTATSYRAWLDRWAVRFVVLPTAPADPASGVAEAELVAAGLPYLQPVWSDASWTLYAVSDPNPLTPTPNVVTHFDATEVVVRVVRPGPVLVRIASSPWLSLIDTRGQVVEGPEATASAATAVNVHGCLAPAAPPPQAEAAAVTWTILEAPHAGTYRIAAPYHLPRGTACPAALAPATGAAGILTRR